MYPETKIRLTSAFTINHTITRRQWKITNPFWRRSALDFFGRNDAKAETPVLAHLMQRVDSLEKTLMLGGIGAGEGDDRGWDGWMASLTRWTWVWVNSGSWWWTGRPAAAAAAAKSLQSYLTLCYPIDGSPPGSPVPEILQARTLEWVAISFSNAWKWKVKVKSLSRVQPSATPWTAAVQAPSSMGFSRQEYWSGVPLPSPSLYVYAFVNMALTK